MPVDVWAVLASGPSLTAKDVALIQEAGLKTIAVNSTWKMARFCDVIYAGDRKWWHEYGGEVDISAQGVTFSRAAAKAHGLKHHKCKLKSGYNSGMLAIDYAATRGAKQIILLGYDGSVKHGIHHHGKHEKTHNPNPKRCKVWQLQFAYIAKKLKGVKIANCSRYTEIEAFPKARLEDVLCTLTSVSDTPLKSDAEPMSAA